MSRLTPKPKLLDWQQARERLAQLAAAAEESMRLSGQRAQDVLEKRARELARVPAAAPLASEVLEVVTFNLGDEHYAIETRHVRGVVRLGEWTPVPGAPEFLVGVINLRGEVLALFDLRPLFGMSKGSATEQSRVVVLGGERVEFGLLVDSAHEVRTLRTSEVLTAPGTPAGQGPDHLRGVTRDALIVLDGAVLLQDRHLFIDQDSSLAGRN
jgi:purine-binding chemotaxis protein CheW